MEPQTPIKLIECPRDALQGIKEIIPTAEKAAYLNKLLRAGFDTLDFGSFVSPRAVPQMSDTAAVLDRLDLSGSPTRLLAIVANERGAKEASARKEISYLGFPFSVSETFQRRNTNSGMSEALDRLRAVSDLCGEHGKTLVVYLSMGFGNPYGDPWNADIVMKWAGKVRSLGAGILSLSDTVGAATPESIRSLFGLLIPAFPGVEWGAHLHTHPHNWREKIEAAWESGCRRFDGALKGYGGCPMAADELVGNMATENLLQFLWDRGLAPQIDASALEAAVSEAEKIFRNRA